MTGCALTVAAAAADRLAFLSRRPRRFIWLTALIVTTCWPAVSLVRAALFPLRDGPKPAPVSVGGVDHLTAFPVQALAWEIPSHWTLGVVAAWVLCSSLLLGRLALGVWEIRRQRATWAATEVDGMCVQLSSDDGPAVIGLHPMQVVLPQWVLGMERPLRELVLRHEAEHRAARDPYLLLVAALLTALLPWNVPLWLQARRLRLAIEIDCDGRVLRAHTSWPEYAHLLVRIAQRRAPAMHGLTLALSESTSNLERRIATMTAKPTPSRFHTVCLSIVAAVALALACAVDRPDSPDRSNRSHSVTEQARPSVSTQPLDPAGSTFFEFQVDKPVTPLQSLQVQYPPALKRSGVSGEVLAQFVVDQTGRVDMSTFSLLNAPDPQFSAAVKAALPTWQLEPATLRGKKVKQLVQQSFVFGRPPDA